jgi:tetratricopeptide (TPR) repeat protein
VLAVVKDLAQGYKQMPEAHFAVAQSAYAAGKHDLAMAEVREAMTLRPDWEIGALLQAQMLQQAQSTQKALDYLRAFLDGHPKRARRAPLCAPADQRQAARAARAQYQIMLQEQPANRMSWSPSACCPCSSTTSRRPRPTSSAGWS